MPRRIYDCLPCGPNRCEQEEGDPGQVLLRGSRGDGHGPLQPGDGIFFESSTDERDWTGHEGRLCGPGSTETTRADASPGPAAGTGRAVPKALSPNKTTATGPRIDGPRREGDRYGGLRGDQGPGDATCPVARSPPPSSATRVNGNVEAYHEEYEDLQEYAAESDEGVLRGH